MSILEEKVKRGRRVSQTLWVTFPRTLWAPHIQALRVIVTELPSAGPQRDTLPGEGGGPSCSLRMHASSDQRALLRTEILSVFIAFLPWLWYFVFRDRCPNGIWSFLFFKPSFEYFFNVIHAKRTDCRTRNAGKEAPHQGTADLFWVPTNKTQSAF